MEYFMKYFKAKNFMKFYITSRVHREYLWHPELLEARIYIAPVLI